MQKIQKNFYLKIKKSELYYLLMAKKSPNKKIQSKWLLPKQEKQSYIIFLQPKDFQKREYQPNNHFLSIINSVKQDAKNTKNPKE